MPAFSNPQEEITYLKRQLLATQEEFKDFTYTVSHDFGAPLRAVVNFSKMLSERNGAALDDKSLLYLRFITQGGEKMQEMLTGLLQFSRLNTQAKPPTPLSVPTLIGQCHVVLKDKIAARKANIAIHGTLPDVVADADQFFQLLLALLDNALTYHNPGASPQIKIAAYDEGMFWKFTIEDNGVGIPSHSAGRVFKVFKRLHTDEEYPGAGMGLALAKKIVERHGGDIGVMSEEHGGTCCWFTVPKTLPQAAASLEQASYG